MESLSIIVIGVGCWGEGWVDHHHFKEGIKSILYIGETKQKRWKEHFWKMVVIGLGVELIAFGVSFVSSNREIEGLRSANLELQTQVLRLEEKTKERHITLQQRDTFKKLLEHSPKGFMPITTYITVGEEASTYASEIKEMCSFAGYDTGTDIEVWSAPRGVIPKYVWWCVKSKTEVPAFFEDAAKAFEAIGVFSATNRQGGFDNVLSSNEMKIVVGRRP